MKKIIKNKKIVRIISGVVVIGLIMFGYSLFAYYETETVNEIKEQFMIVQTHQVISKNINNNISFLGSTLPMEEVMVSSKVSSKLVSIYVEEGGIVTAGQVLFQLEQDPTLLVSQNNAQASLTNTITAVNQDITMAELAVNTAQVNLDNIKISTEESVRNSELAVEAAELVLDNAEKSLGNAQNANEQIIQNSYDSSKTTMQSNLSTINTALTAVGDIIGESPGNIFANSDYSHVLGATNHQSLSNTENLFFQARNSYEISNTNYGELSMVSQYSEIDIVIDDVKSSLDLAKQTLNQARILLENTIACSGFSSASLAVLKISVDTNLISINTAISALQTNEQAIKNAKLADIASSDNTDSAYNIAVNNLERFRQALILAQVQAKAQIDVVKKQLEFTQTSLESVKSRSNLQIVTAQGQFDSIQAQLENLIITAPISGTLNQIFIESGEMALAGKPIAKIVNISGIEVELALTEFDIGQVFIGQEVVVSLAAYPNKKFNGNIYYISSVADTLSKKFPIKIQISNENKDIKAGMIAEIQIITNQKENVLIIPQEAVFEDRGEKKVYLVNDSLVKIKIVETIVVNDAELIVIKGLDEGDEIIINGLLDLTEGEQVKIDN